MVFSSLMVFMGFVAFFNDNPIICVGCFITAGLIISGNLISKELHNLDTDWSMDIALKCGVVTPEEFLAFCKKSDKGKKVIKRDQDNF